jgi:hypothetical protein
MEAVKTEFLFEIKADLDREGILNVGDAGAGTRRIVYVTGGTVVGPKVNGEVLPGGGDWLVVRPDGTVVLDVRA